MKNKSSKKEKGVDVIARHLVEMEKRIDGKFSEVNKKIDDMNFKLDTVTFSHGRRIEVLEDDMIRLKKLTHKK